MRQRHGGGTASIRGLVLGQPAQLRHGEGGDRDRAHGVDPGCRAPELCDQLGGGARGTGVVPQERRSYDVPRIVGSTLAAVAGILLASRDNSISPTTGGASTLLYAVGAAVIGGTSLFGGKGRILDAILGGLVIAVIINGMGLLNQPSSVVYMVTGIVLLVAASVDALSRRRAASTGRA